MDTRYDEKLRLDVLNEFSWELVAAHLRKVDVSVKDGTVTLRGRVHYTDRYAAVETAKRVPGVTRVVEDWI